MVLEDVLTRRNIENVYILHDIVRFFHLFLHVHATEFSTDAGASSAHQSFTADNVSPNHSNQEG